MTNYQISTFYKFFTIPTPMLKPLQRELTNKAKKLSIKGLALISPEGVNASFSGKESQIESFKKDMQKLFQQDFFWKDSYSHKVAFKRLSVKIKKEIINIGEHCPVPLIESNKGDSRPQRGLLSAKKWEDKLKKGAQILDVRNNYEVLVGRFKKAQDLNLDSFQEFTEKINKAPLDKNKETLIYCTGGIRCEKARQVMKNKGFKKVYQLNGGILNYLKNFPHSQFENECFVFDHRASLNQKLEVSKRYSLCPHCGQAGDLRINCQHCQKPAVICQSCKNKAFETCSKNCDYHFKKGHNCRKKYSLSSFI